MHNLLVAGTLVLALISSPVNASPEIYDPVTGKYLGNLSANPYDPNSTSNPYGEYGSSYSPDSINNPYGEYGSKYSPKSPNNPYNTNPPIIIDRRKGGK